MKTPQQLLKEALQRLSNFWDKHPELLKAWAKNEKSPETLIIKVEETTKVKALGPNGRE